MQVSRNEQPAVLVPLPDKVLVIVLRLIPPVPGVHRPGCYGQRKAATAPEPPAHANAKAQPPVLTLAPAFLVRLDIIPTTVDRTEGEPVPAGGIHGKMTRDSTGDVPDIIHERVRATGEIIHTDTKTELPSTLPLIEDMQSGNRGERMHCVEAGGKPSGMQAFLRRKYGTDNDDKPMKKRSFQSNKYI